MSVQELNPVSYLSEFPDVLTVSHLSQITGECPATIRMAAANGQLKGMKIGRRWFFLKQTLIDSLQGAE